MKNILGKLYSGFLKINLAVGYGICLTGFAFVSKSNGDAKQKIQRFLETVEPLAKPHWEAVELAKEEGLQAARAHLAAHEDDMRNQIMGAIHKATVAHAKLKEARRTSKMVEETMAQWNYKAGLCN